MHIQELSQNLNLSKKSIYFYENKGLIHPSRDEQGYRVYNSIDQQTLLQIKMLRRLGFHIDEIKDIIIHKNKELFTSKKKQYQNQLYEILTSIQYIDELEKNFDNNLEKLSFDLEETMDLKNIEGDIKDEIDFDQIIFCCVLFAWGFATKMQEHIIYEMISCGLMIFILLLHFSVQTRNIIYKMFKK